MQQLTTVYQKYVTKNDQSVNPTFLKCGRLLSHLPLRIDAPLQQRSYRKVPMGFRLVPLNLTLDDLEGSETKVTVLM